LWESDMLRRFNSLSDVDLLIESFSDIDPFIEPDVLVLVVSDVESLTPSYNDVASRILIVRLVESDILW
ncbi:hypothetical protein, partial [Staphylococcus aureus]